MEERQNYFIEVIGNGGVTMQILQVYTMFIGFIFDSIEAIKSDANNLPIALQSLENIIFDSGTIHPDLFVYLSNDKPKFEELLKSFVKPPESKKATAKTAIAKDE
ncbi:hypothetical protein [Nostoc phage A1]|nr:hypothetical protein [Nostoc phage A1]